MDVRTAGAGLLAAVLMLAGCSGGTPAAEGGTGAGAATAAGSQDAPVTIYLVRHGETIFNELGQMQGWCDSQLTPEGEEQADAAGVALADHDFVAAYASDLGRTRQTAEHLLAAQGADAPELVTMPELREFSFGGFEGTPNDDAWGTVLSDHGYDWGQVQQDFVSFIDEIGSQAALATMFAESDPLGLAEDEQALTERLTAGFEAVVADAVSRGGGDVLVVSHGMSIGALLELLDPEGYQATQFHNLALSIIEVDGGTTTVVSTNDTGYLDAA
jgi:broad specificity phosphatase PhoE